MKSYSDLPEELAGMKANNVLSSVHGGNTVLNLTVNLHNSGQVSSSSEALTILNRIETHLRDAALYLELGLIRRSALDSNLIESLLEECSQLRSSLSKKAVCNSSNISVASVEAQPGSGEVRSIISSILKSLGNDLRS